MLCVSFTARLSGVSLVQAYSGSWPGPKSELNENIFVLVWERQVLPVKNNIVIIQLVLHGSLFKLSEALLDPQTCYTSFTSWTESET